MLLLLGALSRHVSLSATSMAKQIALSVLLTVPSDVPRFHASEAVIRRGKFCDPASHPPNPEFAVLQQGRFLGMGRDPDCAEYRPLCPLLGGFTVTAVPISGTAIRRAASGISSAVESSAEVL